MRKRRSADPALGPLELQVMDVLWSRGAGTPADVKADLAPRRDLAYTTVMTVLSRLHEKGILSRRKIGRAFEYTPRKSRIDLVRERASSAIRALSGADAQPVLSFFVDAASQLDDEQLAKLEGEIAKLREGRS